MIYATQLRLGLKDIVSRKLTDAYSIHRIIYSLFEDNRDEKAKSSCMRSGFVFCELEPSPTFRNFLILSNRSPRALDLYDGSLKTKMVPESFLEANVYRFTVWINPTKRNNETKNLQVIDKDEIASWFKEKSEKAWGFTTEYATLDKLEVDKFSGKNRRPITIARAKISGKLYVKDRDLFKKSFTDGIGRGHAFGCGLLQIVPLFN